MAANHSPWWLSIKTQDFGSWEKIKAS